MTTNVPISKRLVLINSASGVVARLVNVLVMVWLYQYLLKRISPEEYSLLPVLSAVMVFLPLFTGVLTAGLGRYVVEAYAKGDERRVTQIVSTMFPLTLAAGVVLFLGGCVFAWYVDRVLTIAPHRLWDARIMMGLMVASFSATVVLGPFRVGLYVRQKFVLSNALDLGRELLRIGLLFVLLLGVSTRVRWVVVAQVCASACFLLVTVAVSRRVIPALRFRLSEIRWKMAKELTSFGGWSVFAQVADMIRTAADPIILNKLATAVDVTSFHLGSLPLRHIQAMSSLVLRPLQPQLTAMHATGSKERLRNAYLRGGRYVLWASLFVAVPLMVFSRELFELYLGPKAGIYRTAAAVTVLLLATLPIGYGHIMLSDVAVATARVRSWAIRVFIIQMTNLALTFYLVGVRGMGAVGSALATFLVYVGLYPVLHWPLGLRLAGVGWRRWFRETLWPGLVPGLAAAAVMLALKFVVHPGTWLTLGLCAGGGMAVYGAVLFGFCLQPVDHTDLAAARASLIRRWLGKTPG